ncbi:Hypothetical protein Minf_0506 [Methylacidiphilum infernorum V4]|uniref:Uncharacterized protein n=1 Tax=Methylacidiphilum infernorum (isolate V4) TaxID=481448 RepID=B3DZE7_METI4|nr:Hypothetical protein Minf_0506 [Methylacidiphilum infernorum V4]
MGMKTQNKQIKKLPSFLALHWGHKVLELGFKKRKISWE